LREQAHHILSTVFGYTDFRPVQLDIVLAVLDKRDCLALLPTGGGKSICFQVPALVMDGICVVVSPLIALMKDQVDNLKRRGILAVAIYSGMSKREIDTALDNCIYGNYKFLYVSPERLKTEIFLERFKQMKVNLIAVDEAHCISQWGYDFRPPYLEIASIRQLHPEVPCLALTASATKPAQEDILLKLELKNPAVFVKSFSRKNLSYSVRMVENKQEKALEILQKIPGTAIVYVRNRKGTKQMAEWFAKMGLTATYYHAGLDNDTRAKRQQDWKSNKVRVIVATNAFGMGIDKPDVRLVLHMDLPENLENYYQEAGRAGRDERKAYAVLLTNEQDLQNFQERAALAYPPVEFLKKVYQCLANHYRMAVGSGFMVSYDFDLPTFAATYELDVLTTYNALKVLQEEGMLELSESFFSPSSIRLLVGQSALYEFQIANAKLDPLIKVLLRTYGGELFVDFIKIQENKLAKTLQVTESEIVKQLNLLDQQGIVAYNMRKDSPQVTFLTPRHDAGKLPLNIKRIGERSTNSAEKTASMLAYVNQTGLCRSVQISVYFGEAIAENCGICDVCVQQKQSKSSLYFSLRTKILKTLMDGREFSILTVRSLLDLPDEDMVLEVLRQMEDEGLVFAAQDGIYKLNT
jgi:ATP-dependent DNA helicase RecQ